MNSRILWIVFYLLALASIIIKSKYAPILILEVLIVLLWFYYTKFFGAQFLPSQMNTVDKMLEMANIKKNDVLYDLGSGDGRILIRAAKKYRIKVVGIEIDPLRVLISRLLSLLNKTNKNVKVIRDNFFKANFKDADIVTIFLLPETLDKLKNKFEKELKRGSRIVTNSFKINGWKPGKVNDKLKIYLYKMK